MKTNAKKLGCILCAAFFLFGCSFHPEVSKETGTECNDVSLRENLALLKAGGNFTLDEEYLTDWVTMMLNPDTEERGTVTGKTVITSSKKLPVSEESVANRSAYARSAAGDEPPVDIYVFTTENTGSGSGGYVIASNDLRVGVLLAIVEDGSPEDEPELFSDIVFAGIANLIDYTIDVYNSISEEEIQQALEDSASRGSAIDTNTSGLTVTDKEGKTGSGTWTGINGTGLINHYYSDIGNVTKASWSWDEGYYATVPVLWHQDAPYNYVVKKWKDATVVTGCGPTVVAQLMAFHGKPTKSTYLLNPYSGLKMDGYTYNWDNMRNGIGSDGNPPTGGFMNAAVLMYEIGRRATSKYTPKSGSTDALTGTTPIGVLTALQAMGYKTPAAFTSYDFSTVKSSIKNRKPVIVLGYSNPNAISGGHYWLIDGVRNMEYKETVTKGGVSSTWKWDYTNWVRCNTGWDNYKRTAWYISGIFDFREGETDSWAQSTVPYYYQYGLRMLPNVEKK
jgi:hypothetical protein